MMDLVEKHGVSPPPGADAERRAVSPSLRAFVFGRIPRSRVLRNRVHKYTQIGVTPPQLRRNNHAPHLGVIPPSIGGDYAPGLP